MKKKLKKQWLVVIGTTILVSSFTVAAFANSHFKLFDKSQEVHQNNSNIITESDENLGSVQRIFPVEPEEAITITDDWIREEVKQFLEKNEIHSLKDIHTLGHKISYEITSEDDTWVRPVYSEYWHSTYGGGKYGYIPDLISYAQRNLFVYSGGLSEGAGLYHHLGFTESLEKPVGSSFNASESFEIWAINRKIKEIIRLDNEWLIVVEPQLQGYQTVKINYADNDIEINETTEPRTMLFRVVTPDGYELERTASILPIK
ncbi:copper amine oxidase N-terminal domain-containing protein [Soehngenia saccharolytica]|nr:copper amine oxidase N-terminal domain-containing protein [Soehngenia saccharolytica]